jgi:hypothetical protein
LGPLKCNNVFRVDTTKYTSNNGDFDCHADAMVQCGVRRLMEHIPGFTRSHWMPPSGDCLHHNTMAAAMVDTFGQNTKHEQKTIFSWRTYGRPKPKVVRISYYKFLLSSGSAEM